MEKDFLIIWHYMANYGVFKVKATNQADAFDNFLYKNNKEVEVFIVEPKDVTTFNEHKRTLEVLK